MNFACITAILLISYLICDFNTLYVTQYNFSCKIWLCFIYGACVIKKVAQLSSYSTVTFDLLASSSSQSNGV